MLKSLATTLCLLAAPAHPSDAAPSVARAGDGYQATAIVAAAPEVVRATLADAGDLSLRTSDVLSVEVVPRDACVEVRARTRGLTRPLTYRALRCPTDTGYRESLLETGDFKRYESEWRIDAVEGGSRVSFRVVVDPDVPAPRALVLQNVKRSTLAAVTALQERLAGPR
ncbi:MAG: SRPBCC family protein [Deltaproteobacteria bacterium]|nr:SRPBCC family protein [Deltaproteobacteria bacterium]